MTAPDVTFGDWLLQIFLSGAFATLLAGTLAYLARNLITIRLTKAVEHEFNAKLEAVKAQLQRAEGELQSVRSGALSGAAQRQAHVDKRMLDAIDQLWSGVIALSTLKSCALYMAVIKFEAMAAECQKNPKARELFKPFLVDPSQLSVGQAREAHPHVSQLAWALFSAYSAVLGFSTLQVQILHAGLDTKIADPNSVIKLVKLALPHHAEYLDKFGMSGAYHLLEQLEQALLKELQRMKSGKESDEAAVKQAVAIVKQTNEVQAEMVKSQKAATEAKAGN